MVGKVEKELTFLLKNYKERLKEANVMPFTPDFYAKAEALIDDIAALERVIRILNGKVESEKGNKKTLSSPIPKKKRLSLYEYGCHYLTLNEGHKCEKNSFTKTGHCKSNCLHYDDGSP